MDADTAVAIDGLASRIEWVETSLHSRIDSVEASVHSRMDSVEASLRLEILDLRIEMRAGFAALTDANAETRRHSQVMFESLRDDIRLLAEGFAHLSTKIEGFFR